MLKVKALLLSAAIVIFSGFSASANAVLTVKIAQFSSQEAANNFCQSIDGGCYAQYAIPYRYTGHMIYYAIYEV